MSKYKWVFQNNFGKTLFLVYLLKLLRSATLSGHPHFSFLQLVALTVVLCRSATAVESYLLNISHFGH